MNCHHQFNRLTPPFGDIFQYALQKLVQSLSGIIITLCCTIPVLLLNTDAFKNKIVYLSYCSEIKIYSLYLTDFSHLLLKLQYLQWRYCMICISFDINGGEKKENYTRQWRKLFAIKYISRIIVSRMMPLNRSPTHQLLAILFNRPPYVIMTAHLRTNLLPITSWYYNSWSSVKWVLSPFPTIKD